MAGERSRQRSTVPPTDATTAPAPGSAREAAPAPEAAPAAAAAPGDDRPAPGPSPAEPAATPPATAPGGTERPARVIPPRSSPAGDAAADRERPRWARPAAWAGLALSLVALAVSLLMWVEAGRAADRRDGTRAATAAARSAVESMLSYSYKTFDQHTADVEKLLTGSFREEFAKGAGQNVKPLAVQNQAVVQARAGEVGVMSASDNTVRVLAFVDQTTTSAKLDRPQLDQNRVILTMTKVDGRWLVSKVEAF